MKTKGKRALGAVAALLVAGMALTAPTPVWADGRSTIQKLVAEKGDAVVTLESVFEVKYSMGGQQDESERKTESTGFVVDEKGTVITALSNLDPAASYAKMSNQDDAYTTRIKSLKYLLPDNSEIPAAVVLRDTDLDIVVVRPLTPLEKPMKYLPLSESATPAVLDEAFTMGRLGRIARRNIVAMSGEIQAIVEKPRTFYVPSGELATARTGVPIFNGEGKLLGMSSIYFFPGGRSSLGEADEPYLFVVVPTADLEEVVNQAKDAKPEVMAAEAAPAEKNDPAAAPEAEKKEAEKTQ